jgi:hypothetical protein
VSVWFVVGFTWDDVVGAGQDRRLAEECERAWRHAGCPREFALLETPGESEHILNWFVNETAARILDDRSVCWRSRVIGRTASPPDHATAVIRRAPA